MIEIAYYWFLYPALACLAIISYWHWFYYKYPYYRFSSLAMITSGDSKDTSKRFLFLLRLITLSLLCFALARFRKPDIKSLIPVQGVDIMLVLDVSGSMKAFDDIKDPRPRIEVALQEAINFIHKRENDPIGLVIFGNVALSRAPLTMDKNILIQILKDMHLGIIDAEGTVLSQAILVAANRLKNSTAKSKIMIVLTDGQPSENDIDPTIALDLAKKLGIKIYTIGIGSQEGGFLSVPWAGLIRTGSTLNTKLLEYIAEQTGGKFFLAKNPKDMETIYTTIDQLEKTEREKPLYARYFEYFPWFLWLTFLILSIELLLRSTVWLRL